MQNLTKNEKDFLVNLMDWILEGNFISSMPPNEQPGIRNMIYSIRSKLNK